MLILLLKMLFHKNSLFSFIALKLYQLLKMPVSNLLSNKKHLTYQKMFAPS